MLRSIRIIAGESRGAARAAMKDPQCPLIFVRLPSVFGGEAEHETGFAQTLAEKQDLVRVLGGSVVLLWVWPVGGRTDVFAVTVDEARELLA